MIVLFDNDKSFSYQLLYQKLNEDDFYYKCYSTEDLFDYFINLLKSIVSNEDIILVDSFIDQYQISNIDPKEINKPYYRSKSNFISFRSLVDAIISSKSNLTIFTSGTNGQPKKIVHSVSNIVRNVRFKDFNDSAIWGFAYNKSHIAGIQVFFQAICNNNTLVNLFSQTKNEILYNIKFRNITHISATPTFYRLLFPCNDKLDMVQRVSLGGEKSTDDLYRKLQDLFPKAKINNIYASTEAGTLFVSQNDVFKIPKSIKHLIKFDGNELLLHKTLLGTSETFFLENDFYKTGDLIELLSDDSDCFRFVGRKNNLINVGGYKINPEEIEHEILKITDILHAYVYSVPNLILGNLLCADIQLRKGVQISELQIKTILKQNLKDYKIPRRIKIVENLVITKTGKIKRK